MATNPTAFYDASATNESDRGSRLFKDISLSFAKHPVTGDIAKLSDVDAIKRSVRNLVNTNHYERPFKPGLGGNLIGLLFQLDTERGLNRVTKQLTETIETFEPRVENVLVRVNNEGMESNELALTVFYSVINGKRNQELNLTVTRTR